ncbi:MAG TPA: PAS domain-containing protein, partial [Opitutaceae bacterium]
MSPGATDTARLVATKDWSQTPLGPRESWPPALRTLVDMLVEQTIPMIVLWGPGQIQIYNEGYAAVAADKHPWALGRSNYEVWPEVRHITQPLYARVLGGESILLEDAPFVLARNGVLAEAFFTISYSPVRDQGRIAGILAVLTENTRRVLAERERATAQADRDQTERQRLLAFDAAQMGWWHLDPRTGQVSWDTRLRELFGISAREMAFPAVMDRVAPEDRALLESQVKRALDPENTRPYVVDYRVRHPDGTERWIQSTGRADFAGEGAARHAVAFYGTALDITERKRAEQNTLFLSQLGARFITISDPARAMHEAAKALGEYLRASRCYFAEWEGYDRVGVSEDWRAEPGLSVSGLHNLTEYGMEPWWDLLTSSSVGIEDLEANPLVGEFLPRYQALKIRGYATVRFKQDDHRLVTLVATSDRPRMWRQDELALMENVLARVWPLLQRMREDQNTRFLAHLSAQVEALTDADDIMRIADEEVGRHLGASRCYFFEDDSADSVDVKVDWHLPGLRSIRGKYALADFGSAEWWEEARWHRMVVTDMRKERRLNLESYSALGIQAYAIVPLQRDGRWVSGLAVAMAEPRYWRESELTLLESVVARTWPLIERARVTTMLRQSAERLSLAVDAANLGDFSWEARTDLITLSPRGAEIFGLEPGRPITRSEMRRLLGPADSDRAMAANAHALATHSDYDIEYLVHRPSGGVRWVATRGRGVYDELGRPVGMRGVVQDITARKEIEEKLRAHERAYAADLERRVEERTASLREAIQQMEEFSYSVSHDLRGPLRAMEAYAQALSEDYGDKLDATAQQYIDRIRQSSARMDRLTRDLLTYSRVVRTEVTVAPVDLDRLVNDIVHQYVELQEPKATVVAVGSLGTALGHESSLGQALANLMTNAVKYVARDVKPRVIVRARELDGRVRVEIVDNGIGIRAKDQKNLFRVFERVPTVAKYEGTGVGLAIVRKAVEKMGGTCGV